MSFLASSRLWVLLAVAALAAAYVVVQLRRRRSAVRFSNVALLASVAPHRPGWRRHVPAALLLLCLAALVVALARPQHDVRVPRERATIMMAIDVSISMEADDVEPTRLDAAKDAAGSFADLLPDRINVGLVSFAGTAQVVVAPTTDRELLQRGIESLRLREATAVGEAIFACLDAIRAEALDAGGTGANGGGDEEVEPTPAHIVLMSDGETTVGRPNASAVQEARDAEVPVTTIAYGTPLGTITYQGETVAVPVNGPALEEVADATGGGFFEAATGQQLRDVYADIGSSIGYDTEPREITQWFLGAGIVLAFLAAAGSLLWSARLP